MFATIPAFDGAALETRLIQASAIEEVKPVADITIGPDTYESSEARFTSGETVTILLSFDTMKSHLRSLTGVVDEFGQLS
jgi:hypothetical protein